MRQFLPESTPVGTARIRIRFIRRWYAHWTGPAWFPACPKKFAYPVIGKTPSLKPEQGGFRVHVLSPEDVLKTNGEWVDVYRRLFLQAG